MSIIRNSIGASLGALVAGASFAAAQAPAVAPQPFATSAGRPATNRPAPPHKLSPFHAQQTTAKAKTYYTAAWGVDKLKVSYTSSGNLIRFSYRVSDPARAKPLADKAATPYLFGQRSRAMLQVPVMDKVGALRQAAAPQTGQEYWMVFSNKGNLVKPGDRVNVVIGAFHADGLMVE